ncbi:MAG: PRC-barrel domain-containing protein [Cyanobacteria bacterium NC_groundwater_1444_Ag_S-0.65um_54_12]|nr:PRC-barrel domain-containing protein [Cyanobacteria bacterium NC_groundwater_1444_Ag_S-0.65um_54_12]
MLFYGKELLHKRVVDVATGEELGGVSQVIWDPTSGRVIGLAVGNNSRVISHERIAAITDELISVLPPGALADVAHASAIGKALLTTSGVKLGIITDVILDLQSGLVIGFELDNSRVAPALPPAIERRAVVILPDRVKQLVGNDLAALNALPEIAGGEVLFIVNEDPTPEEGS